MTAVTGFFIGLSTGFSLLFLRNTTDDRREDLRELFKSLRELSDAASRYWLNDQGDSFELRIDHCTLIAKQHEFIAQIGHVLPGYNRRSESIDECIADIVDQISGGDFGGARAESDIERAQNIQLISGKLIIEVRKLSKTYIPGGEFLRFRLNQIGNFLMNRPLNKGY